MVALRKIMIAGAGGPMGESRPERGPGPGDSTPYWRVRRHRRSAVGVAAAALVVCTGVAVGMVVVRDRGVRHIAAGHAPLGAVTPAQAGQPTARRRPPRRVLVVGGRRQPPRVRVPYAASGRYTVVPGEAEPPRGTHGRVVRYVVEVERGLPFRGRDFAVAVHRILNDPRGWGSGGRLRFERTDHGLVQIRVSLSSPALASTRCLPLDTGGKLSCWHDPRAIINAMRWGTGAAGYGKDLASYREYLINHEVGHGLGHGHVPCPGPARPAPVMAQQTKSLDGCRPNPWPFRRPARRGAVKDRRAAAATR
jgi:hypothetical protein